MRAGVWLLFDGGACLPKPRRRQVCQTKPFFASFFGAIAKK